MKLVLSFILFIILLYSSKFIFEDFTPSASTQSPQSNTMSTQSNSITTQSTPQGSTQSNSITTQSELGVVNYFELNNEAKNLVNVHKDEVSLREIQREEEGMRNNVRKIVNHANNVLSFVELNKDYLERIYSEGS